MEKTKVYFTRDISPESLLKLYQKVGLKLDGKVGVKLHSGEKGNQNYVRPEFVKQMIDYVNGTVIECNTAYNGARNTTEKHTQLMKEHKWTKYFSVDIMDAEKEMVLKIDNGNVLKENVVGGNMVNYDSILVLSHFKGHPMGGFGGALKQLSIGFASSRGKSLIHSASKDDDQNTVWTNVAPQDVFLEAMADSAMSIHKYFENKIVYINMLVNLSVDCDCCAKAEDPCMKDIGILASLDPVSIDQACIDLIYNSTDEGRDHFVQRVTRQNGLHIFEATEKINFGSRAYELVDITNE